MSTLKVTKIVNPASTVDNITLNADGSVTLGNGGVAVAPASSSVAGGVKATVNPQPGTQFVTGIAADGSLIYAAPAGGGGGSVSSITGLGTGVSTALAAAPNAANGFVQLDSAGKLPAVDGSRLTNLPAPKEQSVVAAIAGGVLNIDCAKDVIDVALNANVTSVTFSNVPAPPAAKGVTLVFTADGTARTITWPAAVRWPNGTSPTLTDTATSKDVFVLMTIDGGSDWLGFVGGQKL